jgi:hypothetical protein
MDARLCEASDPRDKVFAVFGMLEGCTKEGLVADYTQSIGITYTRMAEFLITRYNSLDVVAPVGTRGVRLDGMPSWAPDWSRPPDPVLTSSTPTEMRTTGDRVICFTSSPPTGTNPIATYPIQRILQAKGYRLGFVTNVTHIAPLEWLSHDQTWTIEDLTTPPDQIVSKQRDYELFPLTMQECLSGLAGLKTPNFHSWKSNPSFLSKVFDCAIQTRGNSNSSNHNHNVDLYNVDLYTQISNVLKDRGLFITDEGHFGFAPPNLKVGDLLCRFRNTKMPHFLRKVSGPPTIKHGFVGECFGVLVYEQKERLGIDTPSWNPVESSLREREFSII